MARSATFRKALSSTLLVCIFASSITSAQSVGLGGIGIVSEDYVIAPQTSGAAGANPHDVTSPQENPLQIKNGLTLGNGLNTSDFRLISNRPDSVVLSIDSARLTNAFYSNAPQGPQVWARYDPTTFQGKIEVTDIQRRMDGKTYFSLRYITPADGPKFAQGNGIVTPFNGVDPFSVYKSTATTEDSYRWHKISQDDFLSVVGMIQRQVRATNSFVGILQMQDVVQDHWDECRKRCLRKNFHQSVTWVAKPLWFVGTTLEGTATATLNQDRTANTSSFQACSAAGAANNCYLSSGVQFSMFNGGNIPSEDLQWNRHQSNSGWNPRAVAAVAIAIALTDLFMTGGLLSGLGEAVGSAATFTFGSDIGAIVASGAASGGRQVLQNEVQRGYNNGVRTSRLMNQDACGAGGVDCAFDARDQLASAWLGTGALSTINSANKNPQVVAAGRAPRDGNGMVSKDTDGAGDTTSLSAAALYQNNVVSGYQESSPSLMLLRGGKPQ